MKIKKILMSLVIVTLMAVICIGAFTTAAISEDPADVYQKITAENEDESLKLWFEPSFKKVFTSDITPSGKDTYSVYMAKNETENAQFVLYSDTDKENLSATVTDFTNEDNSASIPASIYYEMYVTTKDLDSGSVLGADTGSTFIKEGETPDPVVPFTEKFKLFKLNGGKSQAFFIKLKSSADTPSGWYSATLNITADNGAKTIKTAKVFAYVWDFEIPEKSDLQTAFYINRGSYKAEYDYLLENRLNGMDIPGELTPANPYLTNDRVNAVRVSSSGCGNVGTYIENTPSEYYRYADIYSRLNGSDIWDQIKDKLYFYTADEIMAKEQNDAINHPGHKNVNDAKNASEELAKYWPDAQTVIPFHENHPYPYYTMNSPMSNYLNQRYKMKDATQEMIDSHCVTTWCPQLYAFTPQSELDKAGYHGGYAEGQNYIGQTDTLKIRNLNGIISGIFSTTGAVDVGNKNNTYNSAYYFNWDKEMPYGEFADRVKSSIQNNNEKGANDKLWAYSAGWNKSYSYCNHIIDSTGLQTKMLFWQLYQNDVTGYLYYGANYWEEPDNAAYHEIDRTKTGGYTGAWKLNRHGYAATGKYIYGNGVLFYEKAQAGTDIRKIKDIPSIIGSLRVEIMRDGVEEYQMFKMLEELRGEKEAKAVVAKVSSNVVNYLSMPAFSASAKPAAMDDYDYMEAVRRELGNQVEAATKAQCTHEWGSGKEEKPATCTEMGAVAYTCTKCGAVKYEHTSILHEDPASFTVIGGEAATCTSASTEILKCKYCDYEKTSTQKAHHSDPEYLIYESTGDNTHNIRCRSCNEIIVTDEAHAKETKRTNTCTEPGEELQVCRLCGWQKKVADLDAKGHSYVTSTTPSTCTVAGHEDKICSICKDKVTTELPLKAHEYIDGICKACGARDPEYVFDIIGDVNDDGKLDSEDAVWLYDHLANSEVRSAASDYDFNGDGTVDGDDASYLLLCALIPEYYEVKNK